MDYSSPPTPQLLIHTIRKTQPLAPIHYVFMWLTNVALSCFITRTIYSGASRQQRHSELTRGR